jgi:hypothetical protein
MKISNYVFVLFILFIYGCQSSSEPTDQTVTKVAMLIWEGDYAVDGCGFFIEFDDKRYKPSNEEIISDDYKIYNQTAVTIEFSFLHKDVEYSCGFQGIKKEEGIKIIELYTLLH